MELMCPDDMNRLIVGAHAKYCANHGVRGCEELHICCGSCTFTPCFVQGEQMFVCNTSRKVHACGRLCTQRINSEGGICCKLTGLEMVSHRLVHTVSFDSAARGTGKPVVHWGYSVRIHKRRAFSSHKLPKHTITLNTVNSIVSLIFMSRERDDIRTANAYRLKKQFYKRVRAIADTSGGSVKIMACMKDTVRIRRLGIKLAPSNPCISALSTDIYNYWRNNRWIAKAGSTVNIIAAIVHFMTHGLSIKGVCIFPAIPWIGRFSPTDTEYGHLTGIQCRAMSSASRYIKRCVVTSVGSPRAERAFNCTDLHRLRSDSTVI